MATQYSINTRFGALMVELADSEEQALTTKGGLSKDSKAVLANAALILSYLSVGPAAPGEIARAAGIDSQLSGSWKKATAALVIAGLIERSGYGPATIYSRGVLAEESLSAPDTPDVWHFQLQHTIILGATATGKSNLLHALIHQEASFVKDGSVRLYGLDPKGNELRPYDGTVFARISSGTDLESHLAVIREVIEEMRRRFSSSDASGFRSFEPTAEVPTVLLIIDELDWLLDDTEASDLIGEILAMGRSAGVFVIAAAQELSRGGMGRTIGNFAGRILFHQRSLYINDLMLGEGAAKAGADSTALEAPSFGNDYAGAGVAYASDSDQVRKVRFPKINDEDIADLIRNFEEAKS